MTLNDLREDLKEAFRVYRKYSNDNDHRDLKQLVVALREHKNMLQSYRFAKMMTKTPRKNPHPYYKVMANLAKAGDIYYHAKKHGMKSAMLYKLSID